MRTLTTILAIALAAFMILTAYFFIGGTLSTNVELIAAMATDYPTAFSSAAGIYASGISPQAFADGALTSPDNYAMIDITVNVKNSGMFAANWITASITPALGDVFVYSVSDAENVPAHGTGAIRIKLVTLTTGNGLLAESGRVITLDYYVFGMHRTVKINV